MRNARRRPRSADEDGSTFLRVVLLLRLQERSSTNFLRDSTRDLFPRVDGVTGLRFLMSRACQERAKLKILHEDRGSEFKVSSIGIFNSKFTAFESAYRRIIK